MEAAGESRRGRAWQWGREGKAGAAPAVLWDALAQSSPAETPRVLLKASPLALQMSGWISEPA